MDNGLGQAEYIRQVLEAYRAFRDELRKRIRERFA